MFILLWDIARNVPGRGLLSSCLGQRWAQEVCMAMRFGEQKFGVRERSELGSFMKKLITFIYSMCVCVHIHAHACGDQRTCGSQLFPSTM